MTRSPGALPPLSGSDALRYHRQIILPEIGEDGQRKLKAARVLLVGAGGLGSPAALYLAAAGVGHLKIVDADRVDVSNLQRQILHDTSRVGDPKAASAVDRLAALNPEIEIEACDVRLDAENALDILGGYDVVLDGSDNFPTRYLINDACVLLGIPYVYGATLRSAGPASVCAAPGGPCYRCLFRDPPPPDVVPSCAEAGVLGVLPGLVGTIQATETIKLLLGTGRTLVGRLLLVDSLDMEFREVLIRRDPECAVCGDAPTVTELIDYERFCGGEDPAAVTDASAEPSTEPVDDSVAATTPESIAGEISVAELKARREAGESLRLLDVREPHEWAISAIEGAEFIPLRELPDRLHEFDREEDVVVYCRSGHRSGLVVKAMKEMGYDRALNLVGGVNEWARLIDPSLRVY